MSRPTSAMVLAAGIGARMRPLTDTTCKALIPVAGKALIDHTLDRLRDAGVEKAVVNVHHFADQVEAHVARRSDMEIVISDERPGLLDFGRRHRQSPAASGSGAVSSSPISTMSGSSTAARR